MAPAVDMAMDTAMDTRPPAPKGLVSYWKFDEGTGSMSAESTTYGGPAFFRGNTTWSPGGFTGAKFFNPYSITLDGVSDWVELNPSGIPAFGAAKSISIWFTYQNNLTSGQRLITLWSGGSIRRALFVQVNPNGGSLAVYYAAIGGAVSSNSIVITRRDGWHHVVVVHDGLYLSAYFEGVLVYGPVAAQGPLDSITYASLGVSPQTFVSDGGTNTMGNYLNGQIDDVRIYNRAITQAEVTALFSGQQ
jgi:hypothetical protein